jgi:hypothetical protein
MIARSASARTITVISAPASFTTVAIGQDVFRNPGFLWRPGFARRDLRERRQRHVQFAVDGEPVVFRRFDGGRHAGRVQIFDGAVGNVLNTFTITVHQNFLDQLPIGKQGPILPALDIGTAYLLNNTTVTGIVANQDNPIPYANFRDFMSTTVIYDNFGYVTAPIGSDMNYFTLQSANYTNILKYDPFMSSLLNAGDHFGRLARRQRNDERTISTTAPSRYRRSTTATCS